ncbi:MAG: hypothetical protein ACHQNV_00680 [Vicinamibacteria bacterium]
MRSCKSVSVLVALVLALACSGRAMVGRYVCDRDRTPKDTLELKADGTFLMTEDSATLTGTWSSTATRVELDVSRGRRISARIEGKDLIDSGDGRWTRQ